MDPVKTADTLQFTDLEKGSEVDLSDPTVTKTKDVSWVTLWALAPIVTRGCSVAAVLASLGLEAAAWSWSPSDGTGKLIQGILAGMGIGGLTVGSCYCCSSAVDTVRDATGPTIHAIWNSRTLKKKIIKLNRQNNRMHDLLKQFIVNRKKAENVLRDLADLDEREGTQNESFMNSINETGETLTANLNALGDALGGIEELSKALTELMPMLQEGDEGRDKNAQLKEQAEALAKKIGATFENSKAFQQAIVKQGKQYVAFRDHCQTLSQAIEALLRSQKSVAEGLDDNLARFETKTEELKKLEESKEADVALLQKALKNLRQTTKPIVLAAKQLNAKVAVLAEELQLLKEELNLLKEHQKEIEDRLKEESFDDSGSEGLKVTPPESNEIQVDPPEEGGKAAKSATTGGGNWFTSTARSIGDWLK